jgi:hypothetical protein
MSAGPYPTPERRPPRSNSVLAVGTPGRRLGYAAPWVLQLVAVATPSVVNRQPPEAPIDQGLSEHLQGTDHPSALEPGDSHDPVRVATRAAVATHERGRVGSAQPNFLRLMQGHQRSQLSSRGCRSPPRVPASEGCLGVRSRNGLGSRTAR